MGHILLLNPDASDASDLIQVVKNGKLISGGIVTQAALSALLTGFSASAGTVTANDTILTALNKMAGNIASVGSPIQIVSGWNANTNTPALASGTGVAGHAYRVTVAGTTSLDGITQWNVGDLAVFSGVSGTWVKIDGIVNEVTSVATRTGNVIIADSDINFTDITTGNVSTSAHGFTPKLPNDSTKFLNGIGNYSTPSASLGAPITSNLPFASAINLPNNTTTVVTSVSLPPGKYDIDGNINIAASGVTMQVAASSISTGSASLGDASNYNILSLGPNTLSNIGISAPYTYLDLSSAMGNTTVNLLAYANLNLGTATVCGTITARPR